MEYFYKELELNTSVNGKIIVDKSFLNLLRKADYFCVGLNEDGKNRFSLQISNRESTTLYQFDQPTKSSYHFGLGYCTKKFATCVAAITLSHYGRKSSFLAFLKSGDELNFEFDANAGLNGHAREASKNISVDHMNCIIYRKNNSYNHFLQSQTVVRNSVTMIRSNE